ncbi:hypothetical protein D3C81_1501560 [compost metagenome]
MQYLPSLPAPQHKQPSGSFIGNHAAVDAYQPPAAADAKQVGAAHTDQCHGDHGDNHRVTGVADGVQRIAHSHIEHFARLQNQIQREQRDSDGDNLLIRCEESQQHFAKYKQQQHIGTDNGQPDI